MGWQTESVVQLIAGNTIINANGVFTYSSTPALGNLIASQAPANGTDSFGNAYLQGVVSYLPSVSPLAALQLNGGAVVWFTASAAGGPWTFFNVQVGINTGLPDEFVIDATTIGGALATPQSSAGITTVAQVVAALVAAGVFN